MEILASVEYSANWTGQSSLRFFKDTHVVFSLRHFIHILTPCVDDICV